MVTALKPAAPAVQAVPQATGLAAFYVAHEGAGTILHDVVAGRDATLPTAALWDAIGYFGGPDLAPNGDPTRVVPLPGSTATKPAGSFSISLWVNLTANTLQRFAACFDQAASNYYGYLFQTNDSGDGLPKFSLCNGPGIAVVVGGAPLAMGVWTHLVATYDAPSSTIRLYVNAVLVGTTGSVPLQAYLGTEVPSLGGLALAGGYHDPVLGRIDAIAYYNYALPATGGAQDSVSGIFADPFVAVRPAATTRTCPVARTRAVAAGPGPLRGVPGVVPVAAARAVAVAPTPIRVPATGFQPGSLAGLTFWFRPDDLTGLADGAPIGTLPDASGAGHAITATGAARATYKVAVANGHPVARLDGVANWYQSGDLMGGSGAFTIVLVLKYQALPPSYGGILNYNAAGDHGGFLVKNNGKTADYHLQADSATYNSYDGTGTAVYDTTKFHVATALFSNNARLATYKDGTLDGSLTPVGGNDLDGHFGFGNQVGAADRWMNGDLAEILAYNSALTDASRAGIESYLGLKYALAVPIVAVCPVAVARARAPRPNVAVPAAAIVPVATAHAVTVAPTRAVAPRAVACPVASAHAVAVAPSRAVAARVVACPVASAHAGAVAPTRVAAPRAVACPVATAHAGAVAPTRTLVPAVVTVPVALAHAVAVAPSRAVAARVVACPVASAHAGAATPSVSAGRIGTVPVASAHAVAAAPTRAVAARVVAVPVALTHAVAVAPLVAGAARTVACPVATARARATAPTATGTAATPITCPRVIAHAAAAAPAPYGLGAIARACPVAWVRSRVLEPTIGAPEPPGVPIGPSPYMTSVSRVGPDPTRGTTISGGVAANYSSVTRGK